MNTFKPKSIYFEKNISEYELGKELLKKYENVPKFEIQNHNNIEEISAVVTTNALSAPAIAFLKPCSIPAGQSTNM